MSDHLTPLQVCEALIGPLVELEKIAGYRPKAGYAWRRSSSMRRPGDLPGRVQRLFLEYARAKKIPLKAEWLIRGATQDEIDAVLDGDPSGKVAAE